MLSVIMLSVIMPIVIMLSVIIVSLIMLSLIMLSFIMLSVIILSVKMLSVVLSWLTLNQVSLRRVSLRWMLWRHHIMLARFIIISYFHSILLKLRPSRKILCFNLINIMLYFSRSFIFAWLHKVTSGDTCSLVLGLGSRFVLSGVR